MEKRIRVKDLAPFASIEDLSDEGESLSEEGKPKTILSNIEEEIKPSQVIQIPTYSTSRKTNSGLATNVTLNVTSTTPRIDISRASSSSFQEDSSPERELILGKCYCPIVPLIHLGPIVKWQLKLVLVNICGLSC